MRIRRNLTVSAGVRYEAQTHVSDYNSFMPRVGVTWAPFKSGATTLRTSWGIFHDWLPANTYEQTLRVDGFNQREVDLLDPSFPDVGDVGTAPPANRYLLDGGLRLPHTNRVSGGIDQRLARQVQTSATYAYQRGVVRAPRSQSERAGGRRAAGSRLRQHRRGGVRRGVASARGAVRR